MTEGISITAQFDTLRALRLPELQMRFAEIVGEETRCPNKTYLLRRIKEVLTQAAAEEAGETIINEEEIAMNGEEITQEEETIIQASEAEELPQANEAEEPLQTNETEEPISILKLDLEALQARYLEVLGRATRSSNRRYLIWKIRQAQKGLVPIGPTTRRHPDQPSIEHKVIPLRLPTEHVAALDQAWRRQGLKSRMSCFRHALHLYLQSIDEDTVAVLFVP